MYTRCPECETTFRLGADDLRRAQGRVRCGDCSHVFNALEFLAEEPDATDTAIPVLTTPERSATQPREATDDEDGIELEIRAYDEVTGETWSPLESGITAVPYQPINDPLPTEDSDDDSDDSEYDIFDLDADAETETDTDVDVDEFALYDSDVDDEDEDEDEDEVENEDETLAPPAVDRRAESEIAFEDLPEFDDTVWERIPGVGASEEERSSWLARDPEDTLADGLSYTGTDFAALEEELTEDTPDTDETVEQPRPLAAADGETVDQPVGHDETVEQPAPLDAPIDKPIDTSDPWYEAQSPEEAAMTFDVPADKWSAFFGDEPRPEAVLRSAADDLLPDDDSGMGSHVIAENADADAEAEAATTAEAEPPFDPTASWPDFDSHEEVVMETGEFGVGDMTDDDAFAGDETADDTGDDIGDEADTAVQPVWQSDAPESTTRKGLWLAGIALLAFGAAAQLIHYNRDTLAAHPAYGDTVRQVYAALGTELYPTWETRSYEIRGSEAVAGESGPDVLDIRTQIAAVSDTAVGLPYLRVILRDRWSNPVAAKNFAPDEYAIEDSIPEDGLLKPNQTIAAHVAIVDPGSGAQGYELELCLPRRHTGLDCTGQMP